MCPLWAPSAKQTKARMAREVKMKLLWGFQMNEFRKNKDVQNANLGRSSHCLALDLLCLHLMEVNEKAKSNININLCVFFSFTSHHSYFETFECFCYLEIISSTAFFIYINLHLCGTWTGSTKHCHLRNVTRLITFLQIPQNFWYFGSAAQGCTWICDVHTPCNLFYAGTIEGQHYRSVFILQKGKKKHSCQTHPVKFNSLLPVTHPVHLVDFTKIHCWQNKEWSNARK